MERSNFINKLFSKKQAKYEIFERDGHCGLIFNDSKIKILKPDNYEEITDSQIKVKLKEIYGLKQDIEASYISQTSNSLNVFSCFYVNKLDAMPFGNVEAVIKGIHNNLADNQGIIEAKNGKTKRGYDYIYSIVKTIGDANGSPFGVRYFLRLDLKFNDKILEIYGSFEEQGTTGFRESTALCMASNAGLCSFSGENWSEDPYVSDYHKGICKNLAEKEGLDGLFPENPLSQAREFLLAVLNDEIVIVKMETVSGEKDQNDNLSENGDILIKELFTDECRRHRYIVEL